MVMQASEFGVNDDLTHLRWLHRSRHWAIHRQRQMGPPAMIVSQVFSQDALQMPLVQDDNML